MRATELVEQIKSAGGSLVLDGDRIRYEIPERAASLVPVLHANREEVRRLLQASMPEMPAGVRLISWNPKRAPVVLTRCSVVSDTELFVRHTLGQLSAALAGNHWVAGNWSVRELIERLEQVGVKVELAGR
jgi:hypothetical protein